MERKIGEIFTYNGKIYQVVKFDTCANCAFRENDCSIIRSHIGLCVSSIRFDKTNVIFKEINNMEIKNNQLTIDIPEGMEIDLENSDLAKGIIKFKPKYITYNKIFNSFNSVINTNVYTHSNDTKKVKALAQLINIARYFNGDWNYNVNDDKTVGYAIYYGAHLVDNGGYRYNAISPQASVYYGIPVFKNETDAQYVIDNPNFRSILDAIYKN
jgi:hypothetical protein